MRKLALILALVLTLCSAALAAPLVPDGDFAGVMTYPEDVPEAEAAYVYRYAYPHLPETDEVNRTINGFFTYAVEDAAAFAVPMNGEVAEQQGVPAYTDITSEITCSSEDYFCVAITSRTVFGDTENVTLSAHTFARGGAKAGSAIALPALLGILAGNETDDWLQDRQTAKADDCVRGMVWERIEDMRSEGFPFWEDFDEEYFAAVFYPEEDFYLDEAGDPVFFLQAGSAAPEEEGILRFPVTLEDLLDEL